MAVIAVAIVILFLILQFVRRRVEDPEIWYRTQKLTSYGGTFVVLLVANFVWFQVSNLGALIGVVSASS